MLINNIQSGTSRGFCIPFLIRFALYDTVFIEGLLSAT